MRLVRWLAPSVAAGVLVAFLAGSACEVAGIAGSREPVVVEPTGSSAGRSRPLAPAAIDIADRHRPVITATPTPPPIRPTSHPHPGSDPRPTPQPERAVAAPARPTPASPPRAPEPVVVARPSPPTPAPPTPAPLTPAPAPVEVVPPPASTPPPAAEAPKPAPTPSPSPTPVPTPKPALPAAVLNLAAWKLTMPSGRPGHPTEVRQPALRWFTGDRNFHLDRARRGVVFRTPVGGSTTEHSHYPRTELREMTPDGSSEAGWSNSTGVHVLTVTQAITAVPPSKPHVVAGQVHDDDDDVVMIRLEAHRLFVESDGDDIGVLDPDYQWGRTFTVQIVASPSGIRIVYNGRPKVFLPSVGRGLYFKVGCYVQSNPDHGDRPTAYGEVVVYRLSVIHRATQLGHAAHGPGRHDPR